MQKLLIIGAFIIFFSSCEYSDNARVVYNDEVVSDTLTMSKILEDTTKTLVVALPIDIDSTNIIIHPVGWEVIKGLAGRDKFLPSSVGDVSKSKSDKYAYNESFWVSFDNRSHFHGNMVNLIFENVETGTQRKLTDKMMNIRSVTYLKDMARKLDKHYLLYRVHDKDYNQDGIINAQDLEAYYFSCLDGTNFVKITKDYHLLSDSEVVIKNKRFYFRTIEDVNKDGIFNRKDKYHYYYIDLSKDSFSPVEYFPLQMLDVE